MVRVENPKPEEGTQTEIGEEDRDTKLMSRAEVWGGRQRSRTAEWKEAE